LGIGVRELVSEHHDRQIFNAAPEPFRDQADDAPVKSDGGAIGCVFVNE
jgi:hypothetical protein